MSLGRDIARGAIWTVASRFAVRGVGIISTLILARILVPDDFGLIAQAMLIVEILQTATEFGVQIPLIQNQNATKAHYNTGWTLKIIRGFLTAVLLLLLANPIAVAFDEPRLVEIIYWVSLIPIIRGFVNIGVVDFRKYFEFHKEFNLNLITKLAGFVVVISVAVLWQNYWAFIIGNIAASIAMVVASFILSPYRPQLDLSEWRYLFGFSKWIWLHELARALNQKIDIIALSQYFKTELVGSYQVGRDISTAPGAELSMPVARALFPGLSKLSGDLGQFRRMFVDVVAVSQILALPAALGVAVLAEPFTLVLLGDKWRDAIPFVELLSMWAFLSTFSSFGIVAFNAIGHTRMTAFLSLISLFIRVIVVFSAVAAWGAIGAAAGMLISQAIQTIVVLIAVKRFSLFNIGRYLSRSWRTVLAALIMVWAIFQLTPLILSLEVAAYVHLLLQVIAGFVVYFTALILLWILQGQPNGSEKTLLAFASEKLSGRALSRSS